MVGSLGLTIHIEPCKPILKSTFSHHFRPPEYFPCFSHVLCLGFIVLLRAAKSRLLAEAVLSPNMASKVALRTSWPLIIILGEFPLSVRVWIDIVTSLTWLRDLVVLLGVCWHAVPSISDSVSSRLADFTWDARGPHALIFIYKV